MNQLLEDLGNLPKFQDYLCMLEKNEGPVILSGLIDVAKLQAIMNTSERLKKPVCIVTYNEIQARKLVEDFRFFTKDVFYFPKREIVTYDYLAESQDLLYERMEVLRKMEEKRHFTVVTTIEALMQPMLPKEVLFQNKITLKVADSYCVDKLKEKLVQLGYQRSELIDGKGQFSSRGGIIDVSLTEEEGVRIEFWGDEIDSIRIFRISTQRSTKMEEKITLFPVHEFVLEASLEDIVKRIEKITKDVTQEQQKQSKEDISLILSGDYISKVDKYFSAFYSDIYSFVEYFSKHSIFFLEENTKLRARAQNIQKDIQTIQKTLVEKQKWVPKSLEKMYSYEQILEKISIFKRVHLENQDFSIGIQGNRYSFHFREVHYYPSSLEVFLQDLKQTKKTVVVLVDSTSKMEKLKHLLEENQILFQDLLEENQNLFEKKGQVFLMVGKLSSGWENYDTNLLAISANDLIEGEKKKRRKQNSIFKEGQRVVFDDLKIGDFVVHKTHGIGQYIGVNTIKADGITKDYIKIRYKGEDVLYIPTNQLDSIRKYVGGGESVPKINKLGSKEWENTKARVKKNLREVARELIELYAKRQKIKGYAFSPDTPWQNQFEERFPYQETDDQLRCIQEVKKDMESPKPMDRLLCGDVGYGKTEVAIRAAFKAVMDQKQVAYLVPTTVLADQQYQEFKQRMESFAIKVEVLNRFRTKKEQQEIVRKLKLGQIDVVIGTHRLLSKDVSFQNLGLLIIDEEHRFGVKDKETIKQYKNNVDVLAMTATPIPRTLHMSIVGIRDMSVIYEPPQNRKPVQTYVLEYDEEVVKEAITKELERGGQVFYLYNRVEAIEKKASKLLSLVPEAKVSFAHGKMSGHEIEEIMEDFVKGNTNLLVCTTILESGIDIPNANTIIVENADRLGLAQLYQIRGRVGRASKQAYAYITYKRDKLLSEVADKRLKAMKEFTEFGSGFKIAMRDLEIRGAGSMLGEIQHGHMEQVGYDTYCQLLNEVIQEMKGIELQEEVDIQIDLNVSSYIPDSYISSSGQKIEIYQNIALCRTEEEIKDVMDEMIDRYGDMPKELENLTQIARIKNIARQAFVTKIAQKTSGIVIWFDSMRFNMERLDILIKKYKEKLKFSPGKEPYLTYKIKPESEKQLLKELEELLTSWIGEKREENASNS